MAHASGALLGFTDSDCLPDPDWIAKGVACLLQTPNCGLVGGRIEMFADEPGPPTVATALSVASHLQRARFLQGGWAVCANLFTSRLVVDAVGAMNPAFDLRELQLATGSLARTAADIWQQARVVRLVREEPQMTAGAKLPTQHPAHH